MLNSFPLLRRGLTRAAIRLVILCFLQSFLLQVLNAEETPEGMPPEAVAAADDSPHECWKSVGTDIPKLRVPPRPSATPTAEPTDSPGVLQGLGAKVLQGEPVALRRSIDGPANLRDKPNGKVLYTFEDAHTVLLIAQLKDWYFVRSYYERPCDSGWTHRRNLKPYIEGVDKKAPFKTRDSAT